MESGVFSVTGAPIPIGCPQAVVRVRSQEEAEERRAEYIPYVEDKHYFLVMGRPLVGSDDFTSKMLWPDIETFSNRFPKGKKAKKKLLRQTLREGIQDWPPEKQQEFWDSIFRDRAAELEAFVAEHGRLPMQKETYMGKKLGSWLHKWCKDKRKGKLSPERAEAIEKAAAGAADQAALWRS